MKSLTIMLLTAAVAGSSALAQQQQPSAPARIGSGATSLADAANLPLERVGKNDLIGITVYDSPELTRAVRVDANGEIRLPMLQTRITAAGLYPEEIESAIKAALIHEQVMVDPVVTVSVVEFRSRPISVVGAVRHPVTMQDTGTVTLLDALSQAGGLTEVAGRDILISRPQLNGDHTLASATQTVPVRALYDAVDPALNVVLHGGEVVRVPDAGRVYVLGNVKRPGMYLLTDAYPSSVLKALALSDGLERYAGKTAYVYRTEPGSTAKVEVPVELKKIMQRKSPDVALKANDILFIPTADGRKTAMTILDRSMMVGVALSGSLIYLTQ